MSAQSIFILYVLLTLYLDAEFRALFPIDVRIRGEANSSMSVSLTLWRLPKIDTF